jgi:hypothetical protein
MPELRTPYVIRFPGANEFVTIRSQALSFKKAREGRLKNKNNHGLGIALAVEGDPETEHIEKNNAYEINLHFTQQAVEESLEPFICRESGLYVYTFSGICKHVTPHIKDDIVVAGFEIIGDIPTPVQDFLKKHIVPHKKRSQ